MPDLHRCRVPGGCYFFTVNLLERHGNALLVARIDLLRDAVQRVRRARPFAIDAWVVLPDHIHTAWSLPPGDDDFSTRWRLIKNFFARGLPRTERLSRVHQAGGERGIWQRRFWEHAIRDEEDFSRHVDYIHYNPVHHQLCQVPTAWQFSSVHRLIAQGLYPPNWGGHPMNFDLDASRYES